MVLSINTNSTSLHSQDALRKNRNNLEQSYKSGSSGLRINSASDDAAGLSISEYSRSKNVSLGQALRNANDGISVMQVTEGGMNEIANILVRLKELSIQAASATIGNTERSFVNQEVKQLKSEIDKIAQATQFNDKKLLGADMDSWQVQIGPEDLDNNRFSWTEIKASTKDLGIANIDLSSIPSAQISISSLDNAIGSLVEQRTLIGGMQSRLNSIARGGLITDENQKATISRIKDADIAQVSAAMAKDTILAQTSTAMLAQANTDAQKAIKLLQL